MIEGEIKVGDRLTANCGYNDGGVAHEVVDISGDMISMRTSWSHEPLSFDITVVRAVFERASRPQDDALRGSVQRYDDPFGRADDPGWIAITPETVPGDEIKEVLIGKAPNDIRSVLNVDDMIIQRWVTKDWGGWTHWRPIPPECLPLPSGETPC